MKAITFLLYIGYIFMSKHQVNCFFSERASTACRNDILISRHYANKFYLESDHHSTVLTGNLISKYNILWMEFKNTISRKELLWNIILKFYVMAWLLRSEEIVAMAIRILHKNGRQGVVMLHSWTVAQPTKKFAWLDSPI